MMRRNLTVQTFFFLFVEGTNWVYFLKPCFSLSPFSLLYRPGVTCFIQPKHTVSLLRPPTFAPCCLTSCTVHQGGTALLPVQTGSPQPHEWAKPPSSQGPLVGVLLHWDSGRGQLKLSTLQTLATMGSLTHSSVTSRKQQESFSRHVCCLSSYCLKKCLSSLVLCGFQ